MTGVVDPNIRIMTYIILKIIVLVVGGRECWWVGESAGGWVGVLVGGRESWWVGESAGGWMRELVGGREC